ncbi:MAG: response regulator transcription factor, partial [Candidatus Marsarchaeota archaeon]|nr:response regulator transcription factor [Candidatus Marsarchaeota archaeon]
MNPKSQSADVVLLVEDERRYRMLIAEALRLGGYEVLEVENGREALELAMEKRFDLVLLDVMLPDMDGFTVCQRLRDFNPSPVIMVTARTEDRDNVRALDIGADDYLTKPFSIEELLARVRAVLRRSRKQSSSDSLRRFGDLRIDGEAHRVLVGGEEILLSPTEYKLLWFMANNAGRVLLPNVIAEQVWGAPADSMGGTLKTTMWRLRVKLEDDASNPKYIRTRKGLL